MARIALDAMGGDHGPEENVAGALDAARRGVDVALVGDEMVLLPLLDGSQADLPVIHAPEVIDMAEDPRAAIREKKGASVTVAARLVADGEAAGIVSAGSTGAALAAAALVIRRLPGVRRPAIATLLPTSNGGIIVIDSGANIECRPEHLAQFGVMGSALAETYLGLPHPRVGLLNIGGEAGKGRTVEKQAFELLEASGLNFVGNVEGHDLAHDIVDVFVTDGFSGNVLLKSAEGTAEFISGLVQEAVFGDPALAEAAAILEPRLEELRRRIDPESYGGAHLLGARGVVVIAHGSSSPVAIANALVMAAEGAEHGLVEKIANGLT